ncbi:hypothetical protein AAHE18_08G251900 [Arachis hypogaea]
MKPKHYHYHTRVHTQQKTQRSFRLHWQSIQSVLAFIFNFEIQNYREQFVIKPHSKKLHQAIFSSPNQDKNHIDIFSSPHICEFSNLLLYHCISPTLQLYKN